MYPWMDTITGMHPGREHQGQPLLPMREKLHFCTRVVTWLPGESSSGTKIPNRCVPLIAQKTTPQLQTKESVA